jgi:hypothetical protein
MVHFRGSDHQGVLHRPCDEVVLITYHHQLTSHVEIGRFPMTLGYLDLAQFHQKFINAHNEVVATMMNELFQSKNLV